MEDTPSQLFHDDWENWAKLKTTMDKHDYLQIHAIGVAIFCFSLVIYVLSISPRNSEVLLLKIAFFFLMVISIYITLYFFIQSEKCTPIQIYPEYITYKRLGRKRKWNQIYLEDIKNIHIEKPELHPKKRKNHTTFIVELKDGDIRTFRPTIYETRLGIVVNVQRNKIILHVKYHNEFISVLKSIYGDENWKTIFTGSSG